MIAEENKWRRIVSQQLIQNRQDETQISVLRFVHDKQKHRVVYVSIREFKAMFKIPFAPKWPRK